MVKSESVCWWYCCVKARAAAASRKILSRRSYGARRGLLLRAPPAGKIRWRRQPSSAPLPVERLLARPRTSQRPRRPVEPRLAWPARPAAAPASMFLQPSAPDEYLATDGFLASRSGGRAATALPRARVDAAAADRDARAWRKCRPEDGPRQRPAAVGSPAGDRHDARARGDGRRPDAHIATVLGATFKTV